MKHTSRVLASMVLLTLVTSCTKRQGVETITPEKPAPGLWQTTWVDPQIVLSDSLFTLIRAERIDSFMITKPTPLPNSPRSVEFAVTQSGCAVTVNLLDMHSRLVLPVLLRNLRAGYYKLSVDFSRIPLHVLPAGEYELKAVACGNVQSAVVRRE